MIVFFFRLVWAFNVKMFEVFNIYFIFYLFILNSSFNFEHSKVLKWETFLCLGVGDLRDISSELIKSWNEFYFTYL